MYAIAILRDGPQYRTMIAKATQTIQKLNSTLQTLHACMYCGHDSFFLTGPKGGETKF